MISWFFAHFSTVRIVVKVTHLVQYSAKSIYVEPQKWKWQCQGFLRLFYPLFHTRNFTNQLWYISSSKHFDFSMLYFVIITSNYLCKVKKKQFEYYLNIRSENISEPRIWPLKGISWGKIPSGMSLSWLILNAKKFVPWSKL